MSKKHTPAKVEVKEAPEMVSESEPENTPVSEAVIEPTDVVETLAEPPAVVEIPADVADAPEVVEPTPAVVVTPAAVAKVELSVERVAPKEGKAVGGDSVFVTTLRTQLQQYAVDMAPNCVQTQATGIQHQYTLFSILQKALKAPAGDERAAMDTVLAVVNEHIHGAFSQSMVNRFIPHVRISDDDRRRLVNLIHVFTTTADPKTRKARIKQIDFRKVTESLQDNGRSIALMNYYFPQ